MIIDRLEMGTGGRSRGFAPAPHKGGFAHFIPLTLYVHALHGQGEGYVDWLFNLWGVTHGGGQGTVRRYFLFTFARFTPYPYFRFRCDLLRLWFVLGGFLSGGLGDCSSGSVGIGLLVGLCCLACVCSGLISGLALPFFACLPVFSAAFLLGFWALPILLFLFFLLACCAK